MSGGDAGRHAPSDYPWALPKSDMPGEVFCACDADRLSGPLLFGFSILFLVVCGLLLHFGVSERVESREQAAALGRWAVAISWIFPAEALWHWINGRRLHPQHWWAAVIPVLRAGAKDHEEGTHIWLPGLGWQRADDRLERTLNRVLAWPMIGLAVLIVPLVAIEYGLANWLAKHALWSKCLEVATGIIWMAFVIEFVLMISVTRNKFRYALRHWLDLIVILLPVLAFLRTAQLGRLARLKDLSRTVRAYRLKSLSTRSWRAFLTLEFFDRLARRNLTAYVSRLEEQLADKLEEIQRLQEKLEVARSQHRESIDASGPPGSGADLLENGRSAGNSISPRNCKAA